MKHLLLITLLISPVFLKKTIAQNGPLVGLSLIHISSMTTLVIVSFHPILFLRLTSKPCPLTNSFDETTILPSFGTIQSVGDMVFHDICLIPLVVKKKFDWSPDVEEFGSSEATIDGNLGGKLCK